MTCKKEKAAQQTLRLSSSQIEINSAVLYLGYRELVSLCECRFG